MSSSEPAAGAAAAADLAPVAGEEDAVALRSTAQAKGGRMLSVQSQQQSQMMELSHVNLATTSLLDLCRNVIVANLEKYPPHAFAIVAPDEFEALIAIKHEKTAPKEGKGGLDGTGRMAPALSEKWLQDVQEVNEHLVDSQVVDELVWKDWVEFRFRRGGMTRPRALLLPWPILIETLHNHATTLLNCSSLTSDPSATSAIKGLSNAPMNIDLMQETGVGKTVKKALKKHSKDKESGAYQKLEQLLNTWKDLAADSGVTGVASSQQTSSSNSSSPTKYSFKDDAADLELAKQCPSWRVLFQALKEREEERRNNQGKSMREKRKLLAVNRPKVVKVRPNSKPNKNMIQTKWGQQPKVQQSPQGAKIESLKKESSVMSSRSRGTGGTLALGRGGAGAPKSAFGDAVAFCGVSKRKPSQSNKTVELSNGKRMKIPGQTVQGTSGQPRATASKWKTTR